MGNRSGSLFRKIKRELSGSSSFSLPHSPTSPKPANTIVNFETFVLIWLDPNVDASAENVETQARLRKVLTSLITFDKAEKCEKWLKKRCPDEKIVLIVSGGFGREIVPKIHHLPVLISIYVYCLDVETNKIWSQRFEKIRCVTASTDFLLEQLSNDQVSREGIEDSKAFKIFQHGENSSSPDIRILSFVWHQLLLEILISSNYITTQGTYYELLHALRQYSENDQYGSQLINEFQRTYIPKNSISWLTRETPLSRFVNKALREQDIRMLFALRFILFDIHTELVAHQASSLNVFKLQAMSKNEMEYIRANPGQLMVINGFLFASTDLSQIMSSNIHNNQYETVLFNIKADYRPGVAPFAFLHTMNVNIESMENKVLFMCGSIYEVGQLIYEDSIWTLHLKLASYTDSAALNTMKTKLQETKNLSIVGDLLNQIGEQEKAAIYYDYIFHEIPCPKSRVSIKNQPITTESTSQKTVCTYNDSFVVINLLEHLSEFSSAILNMLQSMTSNIISVMDDVATVDFCRWSRESFTVCTTARFASSIPKTMENCRFFLLDDTISANVNDSINQQRFKNVDDLICRLVDEVIENYRRAYDYYIKSNKNEKAEEKLKQINRIYQESRQVKEKFSTKTPPVDKPAHTPIKLVCLVSNGTTEEDDMRFIQRDFKSYFSSLLICYNVKEFESHLVTEENMSDVCIIICDDYDTSIIDNVCQSSHVKYTYRYGKSKSNNANLITNSDDLRYRVATDLMDYYAKQGEKYRTNRQSKLAKRMFEKAQHLCDFLSKNCF